jgi:hypothetical protein
MTDRWSPPYTVLELGRLFGLSEEDLTVLAEVGMLRSADHLAYDETKGMRFQVHGLGNRYLVHDLMRVAEAAHRLQGRTIPGDCEDFAERAYLSTTVSRSRP